MEAISFRTATRFDSQRIASLHAENWRESYRGILPDDYLDKKIFDERASLWKTRLSIPGADRRYVLLAEIETRLVAFVCVLLDEEPAWGACLDNLHVCSNLRDQGLGRQLFAKAARWVMSMEPGWPIHLWVFEANDAARGFYGALMGEVVERKMKLLPGEARVPSLRYVWRDLKILLNNLIPYPTGCI